VRFELGLGPPHLNFQHAMEIEHCSKTGSDWGFQTTNYGIYTTPKLEWSIVVHHDISNADMRHGRRLRKISEVMAEECAIIANLTEAEVIAVVLYTGPMVSLVLVCMH
jgi:hypothetical protein